VAELNWIFDAGLWYESRNAIASATASLLKNGTSTRTAQQLNEALEFYGASLKVSAGNDHASVTLHCLTKHVQQLLPIVYEIITDASFPEDELELYKQNAFQRLAVNLRQCEFVANQQIDATLFGINHPYGRFSERDTIAALTRQDLQDFHQKHYSFDNMTLFMAGKVGDAEIAALNNLFGRQPLAATAPATPEYADVELPPVHLKTNNDPKGVQGAIRIGRRSIRRNHPDFAGMIVLNTVFGGYFGSRLMSNIREDKGYTYGIYSGMSPYKHDASLIIHTEVGHHVVDDAIREIYHEMDRIREELIDEEELLLVKNYLLGNMLGDLDGPFAILQRWRTLILNGFDEQHFNRNVSIYKSISAAELRDLAQRYLDRKDFSEIIVI
jgi:predicted Zn-dependent peptidase